MMCIAEAGLSGLQLLSAALQWHSMHTMLGLLLHEHLIKLRAQCEYTMQAG
jgi:hypothetical protein